MHTTDTVEQAADALVAQERARTADSFFRKAAERGVSFPYRTPEVAHLPPREQLALLQKARTAVRADTFVQCLRWGALALMGLTWLGLSTWGPREPSIWWLLAGVNMVHGMYALIVRGVLRAMAPPVLDQI
jgi:hypothetical protein